MMFVLAIILSTFVIFILKGEASILYIALVWAVPVTLYFWYESIISPHNIFLKMGNALTPNQSSKKRN